MTTIPELISPLYLVKGDNVVAHECDGDDLPTGQTITGEITRVDEHFFHVRHLNGWFGTYRRETMRDDSWASGSWCIQPAAQIAFAAHADPETGGCRVRRGPAEAAPICAEPAWWHTLIDGTWTQVCDPHLPEIKTMPGYTASDLLQIRVAGSCGVDWTGPARAWFNYFESRHATAHRKGHDGLSACCAYTITIGAPPV